MLNRIKISGSLRPHKTHKIYKIYKIDKIDKIDKIYKIYSRNQNVNSNENLSPLFGHLGLSR